MASDTEPIPIQDALRLCDMAIEDCDKLPNAWTGPSEFIVGWGAAVVRPLIEHLIERVVYIYDDNDPVDAEDDAYPPLAALRDHYDKTRPDWRTSK